MATNTQRITALEADMKVVKARLLEKATKTEVAKGDASLATLVAALTVRVDALSEPDPDPDPDPDPEPGIPGPGNTGVPTGTVLTAGPPANSDGNIIFSTPGAVVDGKILRGWVQVTAPGVTIRNSLIRGPLWVESPGSLTITDCELTGEDIQPVCDPSTWRDRAKVTGFGTSNVTAERLNIHHFGKGVMSHGNFTLRDSWLHDFVGGNCDAGGARTHIDGVFVWPSSGNVFTGNFIDAARGADGMDVHANMTAAIFLYNGHVQVHSDDVYSGNRLSGGSYTVYAGDQLASNVDWTGNVFVRSPDYPNGGAWGPVTSRPPDGNGNTWTDNTWADTGEAV